MGANKTQAESGDVGAYLSALPQQRREDGEALCAMMARVTGRPPTMWGPSMIGFGRQHYRYDSGREGVTFGIGFAPRASENVLYGLLGATENEAALAELGPHKTGKGCLYVRRLASIDTAVLERIVTAGWARAVAAGAD